MSERHCGDDTTITLEFPADLAARLEDLRKEFGDELVADLHAEGGGPLQKASSPCEATCPQATQIRSRNEDHHQIQSRVYRTT